MLRGRDEPGLHRGCLYLGATMMLRRVACPRLGVGMPPGRRLDMLRRKHVTRLLTLVACVAVTCWLTLRLKNIVYDHPRHRQQVGRIIEEIKKHDEWLTFYWSSGWGRIYIDVYEVTDEARQDQIVGWVRTLRERGDYDCD